MNMLQLPTEVLYEIFSYITLPSYALVCRAFLDISKIVVKRLILLQLERYHYTIPSIEDGRWDIMRLIMRSRKCKIGEPECVLQELLHHSQYDLCSILKNRFPSCTSSRPISPFMHHNVSLKEIRSIAQRWDQKGTEWVKNNTNMYIDLLEYEAVYSLGYDYSVDK